jgi:hypothetical protein
MDNLLLKRIIDATGIEDIVAILAQKLSASDFQSLLLAVFQQRAAIVTPTDLLKNYQKNRFVQPSLLNPIDLGDFERKLLSFAQTLDFQPLELSPVCPLGTCAGVATVHQNKVISAARGTEVVADASNVLALETAHRKKQAPDSAALQTTRLCTTHRHIRSQVFDFERFTPHFKIFCMTTGGRDTGSFQFEIQHLSEHILFYLRYFTEILRIPADIIRLKLKWLIPEDKRRNFYTALATQLASMDRVIEIDYTESLDVEVYYQTLNFKIYLAYKGQSIDIVDGGLVDWTQKLLGNRKERLLISGLGTELLFKILHKMI